MSDVIGTAVLKDFPLRIWHRQQEYTSDLLREFQLLVAGQDSGTGTHEVPRRLLAVADMFVTRYAALLQTLSEERQAALDAGLDRIDSMVPLPAGTEELVPMVRELLAEVDDYCRNGDLLMLAAPADVVAMREWSMSEVLRQLRGGEPIPWAGPFD